MGTPPDPRRTDETRRDSRAVHRLGDLAGRGHRSGPAPVRPDLAAVLARPGRRDRRGRLPACGHDAAEKTVCPGIYRAWYPPDAPRRHSRTRPSLASFPPPGRKAHARAAFPWRPAGPPLAPPTGTIGLCGRRQPLGDAREIPLLTIVPAGRVRLWERYGSGHPPACRIVWLSSHLDELTCRRHHALADPCYVSPFERAWRSAPWRPSASLLHTCALVMA